MVTELKLRSVLVPCTDLDRAVDFYGSALGLPMKFRDGASYAAMDTGDVTLALATPDEHPFPWSIVLGIRAQDLSVTDRLEAAGAVTVAPATRGRHEWRALLRAPDGTLLSLYCPLP